MSIHFSEPEFSQRIDRVLARLQHEELDGLLIFRPESMYYLCGFDTFGYAMFQCLYLGSDGRLVLLTRAPDRLQAQLTSTLTDIRIWRDRAGHEPVAELDDMLRSLGCAGAALGIELDTVGLTAANGNRLQQQLDGFCTLRDCSELINQIRLVKSPAELACIETAASLADDALDAAIAHTAAGADEAVILAEMQGAVLRGGGDYAGNEFIIGSADHALLCRYHSGRRRLDNNDQLTLEWAGCYHRYHAAMMRTLLIGKVDSEHRHMFAVAPRPRQRCRRGWSEPRQAQCLWLLDGLRICADLGRSPDDLPG